MQLQSTKYTYNRNSNFFFNYSFLKESLETSQERLTELKVATDNADAIASAAATVKKELVYKYDHEPKKETKKKTRKVFIHSFFIFKMY